MVSACAQATLAAESPPAFPRDPKQSDERTCFQTSEFWSPKGNLRSDVALVYGIGERLTERIESWRKRGYDIHVMTGVAWGNYQDYLYGRFDGENHVDNAQTDRHGNKISHGGDVYYMCPAANFGEFLAKGVEEALMAGATGIHLEEPEFWARAGYSDGFKREWKDYYDEEWQAPHGSVEAQWKASKLKYFLYRRALAQVFARVDAWNREHGTDVKCYVPTHSLLNYAHWHIVSPQSSLARIDGCDGYIAQVWTGTSRTPNRYRGVKRERTFETAFLEYGVMQNLVRSTGRRVWYLNDPVEDNPRHDWTDYRTHWESTLTASLLQPEVWRFEVAPWPERAFGGRYPRNAPEDQRQGMPPDYATELQVVMSALADMNQEQVEWDSGTRGIGVLVSDSLMFQREDPAPSDPDMAHIYGQALPLVKRGMPVEPVQLENVGIEGFLDPFKVLTLTYSGQKPLSSEPHQALAQWVRQGGELVVVDDDADPYLAVPEWWNDGGKRPRSPRLDLFERLGLADEEFVQAEGRRVEVGEGAVVWLKENPATFSDDAARDDQWVGEVQAAAEHAGLEWRTTSHLMLQRGPYRVVAGLDESPTERATVLEGRWINLFDPRLEVQPRFEVQPGTRALLLDLQAIPQSPGPRVLAAGCKALPREGQEAAWTIEGVGDTPGVLLVASSNVPLRVEVDGEEVSWESHDGLCWIRFRNEARPRVLRMVF
ncbi:hypothetical protein HNR46_001518 [Haloferula luteola]|uniref:Uncharacterized protein n=1 Tax=Haloferula luteola TaxID=595692 RepID=A0A840UZT7_9BACT|nr:hypothetical protein [Haloferula luteola]MBB5351282.1 hypothetical protein [Haloferula luteola]